MTQHHLPPPPMRLDIQSEPRRHEEVAVVGLRFGDGVDQALHGPVAHCERREPEPLHLRRCCAVPYIVAAVVLEEPDDLIPFAGSREEALYDGKSVRCQRDHFGTWKLYLKRRMELIADVALIFRIISYTTIIAESAECFSFW